MVSNENGKENNRKMPVNKKRRIESGAIKNNIKQTKEERRNIRIGVVIAIISILITALAVLKEFAIDMIAIWPETGVFYWYRIILLVVVLASVMVIFFDILIYVVNDLQRHNVIEKNYECYDEKSDRTYATLMNDFKMYMILMVGLVFMVFPLNAIWGKESERWSSIISIIALAITGGIYLYVWMQNDKKKMNLKRIIEDIGNKLIKLATSGVCCFTLIVSSLLAKEACVVVNYSANGDIEIWNESNENYNGLDIEIINVEDGRIVYNESVKEDDILLAEEHKSVSNHMGKGFDIQSENVYWKYEFNLDKELIENNRYYILIKIFQENKSFEIKNMFYIEDDIYLYTKDYIKKEY